MNQKAAKPTTTKRKAMEPTEESMVETEQGGGDGGGSDADADADIEMIDVDFDFFDPQAHDYHAIKLLLSQLLSRDAALLDLGGVTDLILEQKLVGSTVKTDGNEGDPYAVLTVLNITVHQDKAAIATLLAYILSKSSDHPALHASLTQLFALPLTTPSSLRSPKHIGLVLSERMVNMPPQLAQPMYRMLDEELNWARDANTPYHFSHLLFLSRVFVARPDSFDDDPNAAMNAEEEDVGSMSKGKKKKKKKNGGGGGGSLGKPIEMEDQIWVYHPEDDYIEKSATHSHVFKYTSAPAQGADGRAADSFGVETRGKLMLVRYPAFKGIVEGMEAFLKE